jgi:UDP-N-acetylglucosamine 2-epimerase (hydrolysing)
VPLIFGFFLILLREMKRVVFLTGTRADFGKLKSLIKILHTSGKYDVHIFATGMHMLNKYGYTVNEIEKCNFPNIYKFINYTSESSMDLTLAKTIEGLSAYVKEFNPDLIIVHGDRVEALAGAIVGSLNNMLVAHIEGGEVSGTVDELIRHAVSKMSHIHFVSNEDAARRLVQLGELSEQIFVIGSPDVDVMLSDKLPSIAEVRNHYKINFENYAVAMFHPVTTEAEYMAEYARHFVDALLASQHNYVVIYPNNDLGSGAILHEYERLKGLDNIQIYPSIRFEYFLVLLKYAQFMIGNSSAGIREAPYYGLPAINIGTRQQNRSLYKDIINCDYKSESISEAIKIAAQSKFDKINLYGIGNSDKLFLDSLNRSEFWQINKQKRFNDLNFSYAQA